MIGPGLLAGLSDDDPAGITTYSVLGAEHGYELLWVLLLSTLALVLFHDLGARMGIVTGQGLTGLIRQAYGVRPAALALCALVTANLGTTSAEFAGIAAGSELFGVSRSVSVPLAAALVSALVLRGGFHRIERILMVISAVFVTYIVAGLLAGPDWAAAAHGSLVPVLPRGREGLALATATVGTTLAPWGLSFIQSYTADKRLTREDLRYERIDVVVGACLTGVVGFFVVVACAATLHADAVPVHDASDAAQALQPLAGDLAGRMFGLGLVGAALLAASILPLSTAYSVTEFMGREAALNDRVREAPLFYATYGTVVALGAALILLPGVPLVTVLVLTQVVNAALLLPLLVLMYRLGRDDHVMGDRVATRSESCGYLVSMVLIATCVGALLVLSIT